jgi:UDP-N-acetylmuramate dehydrogenase
MPVSSAVTDLLTAIPALKMTRNEPLAQYTRFGIGGPATVMCDALTPAAFEQALAVVRAAQAPQVVIGGGTNLVVSDSGFDGVVLRYTSAHIHGEDTLTLRVDAGAVLQDVVDHSIALGLKGLQTMTGIPGSLGGAVYGNAGAYGKSIHELVTRVEATDGARMKTFSNGECEFRYRESVFKRHKEWLIVSADLQLSRGDPEGLQQQAGEIRAIRDAKYPPTMKCAGSIFKNLIFAELPPGVQAEVPASAVREGKVPSAWFLEQAGAKGLRRGDIQVATYHANLIYNDGNGTAADVKGMIEDLKRRVRERFGFAIEEEVQYV